MKYTRADRLYRPRGEYVASGITSKISKCVQCSRCDDDLTDSAVFVSHENLLTLKIRFHKNESASLGPFDQMLSKFTSTLKKCFTSA